MRDATASDHVVDALVHVPWTSEVEVTSRLSSEWQEYVGRPNSLPGGYGARPIHLRSPYRIPGGAHVVEPAAERQSRPEVGATKHAVLVQDAGVFLSSQPNPYLGREVVRAANDWLVDCWLNGDDRLHGAVVVANQLPEAAADEIRRAAAHPRMSAVLFGSTGMGKPFGNPVYEPIHAAAVEMDLPIIIHADGDVVLDSVGHASAAGPTATYSEFRALSAQPLMTHLASLVANGIFERHPTLRVLLAGGGMSWLPGFLWRLDSNYRGMRREVPWVKRLPSDYVREHVRLTTYPLDTKKDSDGLRRALMAFDDFEDILCFASGHAHEDAATRAEVARSVPDAWHPKVFWENASALFGLGRD